MDRTILRRILAVAAFGILAAFQAFSQVTTSAIAGRIVDDNDIPLPGVTVVAVYTPSGSQYYSVTDENGYFRLNGLMPGGPYVVTASMLGYSKEKEVGISTTLGQTTGIEITLKEIKEKLDESIIIADASESGMNIKRSGAGTHISEKTLNSIPTTSRALNDVLKLTPQASTSTFGHDQGISIGGGNYRQSYVTVDGAAFNNAFGIGPNLPAGGSPISLDALSQLSVDITPFDVRQSGFTGGAVNAVTKSGSNEFHATVYNYFTSDQLTGSHIGDQYRAMSHTLSNILGASVGGYFIKNKLFFFLNFEYQWNDAAGSSRMARGNESQEWGASYAYNRPTDIYLNSITSYLGEKYGYNPGRYQGYSLSTPGWKIIGRIDWNINDDHKLNVRFSNTKAKNSNTPSSSISPLKNVYNKDLYGRNSYYAMPFESARYFQELNFMSAAAELNSRLGNRTSNLFRLTWSHQNEPRSYNGGLFPTVDILEDADTNGDGKADTKAVSTTFGPDPFTYGNLRDVQTLIGTEEVTFNLGKNNIIAGAQFEWNLTRNGFMQGGAGYYVYNSWDDFKNNAQPAAFCITHANRDDLQQVYPSFQYMQGSIYIQDEWSPKEWFKLTGGLRVEVPFIPGVEGNENEEFTALAKADGTSISGMKTSDMPKTRVNFSPRIGFNWDVSHDRTVILRGGTGLYTGRIPFVWIVSAIGNSNCMQNQIILNNGAGAPKFHTDINDILKDYYSGTPFKAKKLPAPTATTILDKNLRMPTTWKSSLSCDITFPGDIKATLEGIYNENLNDVAVRKLGIKEQSEGVKLEGEPQARKYFVSEGIKNSEGKDINPYYVTNSKDVKGRYFSLTAQLKKDFRFGLSMMAAYTVSQSMVISDGMGDQVSNAFNTLTNNRNGSNVDELGYSSFVSPNRVITSVNYRIDEGGKGATTFGLFYEGFNSCFLGNEASVSRFSYTEGVKSGNYINSVSGEQGARSLLYIPTEKDLAGMTFKDEANRDAFNSFIKNDSYLNKHRGEYTERGCIRAPWYNRVNFRVAQDINFNVCKKVNTISFGLDINNVGNLLNSNWGTIQQISSNNILEIDNGKYVYTAPVWSKFNDVASAWQMLLNIRYRF